MVVESLGPSKIMVMAPLLFYKPAHLLLQFTPHGHCFAASAVLRAMTLYESLIHSVPTLLGNILLYIFIHIGAPKSCSNSRNATVNQ